MMTFLPIMMLLAWGALFVLNMWVWQKSKAQGNLIMMVGSAVLMLAWLLMLTSEVPSTFIYAWLPILGTLAFVAGFFLSVRPMVQVHIEALKKKLQEATAEKKGEEQVEEQTDQGGES